MSRISERFRGYLPVVIDVETAGFNARTDALLEIAGVAIRMDENGLIHPAERYHCHVRPFEGANLEEAALRFTGIDPWHPLRIAHPEGDALGGLFKMVRAEIRAAACKRAILVGHNATFDHGFVMAAAERAGIKRNPFHPFSTLDTAALGALAYGQTVLARACKAAGIAFDGREAHSARYDTDRTAELFCSIVNRWAALGGWPPPPFDDDEEAAGNATGQADEASRTEPDSAPTTAGPVPSATDPAGDSRN